MTNEMEEEFMEEDFMNDDFDDDNEIEMITSVLKTAAKSANKLTAHIIDNNRHNDVRMSTEDIYDIYRNSFLVAITTVAPNAVEE